MWPLTDAREPYNVVLNYWNINSKSPWKFTFGLSCNKAWHDKTSLMLIESFCPNQLRAAIQDIIFDIFLMVTLSTAIYSTLNMFWWVPGRGNIMSVWIIQTGEAPTFFRGQKSLSWVWSDSLLRNRGVTQTCCLSYWNILLTQGPGDSV